MSRRRVSRSTLALLIVATLTFFAASASFASHLLIIYPDIEQGSATLVVSPSGQAMLIDAGTGMNPTDGDVVELIRHLQEVGVITDMDYTLATHYDEDHIGRMDDVLNWGVMDSMATVYDRGTTDPPTTFTYGDYEDAAANYTRTAITSNTTISLGSGVSVRAYVQNAELPDASTVTLTGTDQQENARSVAVVVSYGDVDVWIGGDLTGNDDTKNFADVETAVSTFVGDVDVYTFNHHGSDSSSAQDFLDEILAEVGIVQISANNSHGHPRADILQRFLDTPDTNTNTPVIVQQNPSDPNDSRSDDSKPDYIVDFDDDIDDEPFALAGTLVLASDGTSYQIYGGEMEPVEFSADSGTGTIGDYPPAILWVDRDKRVPTAAQSTTVSAQIHDGGSFTAKIVYTVDGVSQTDISMSQVGSTDVYEGTIPAQVDGAQVKYHVQATDGSSQTTYYQYQGYFSGTTDVDTIRDTIDSDGLLGAMRYQARVRGQLTVEAGVFHPTVSQVWIQDSNGDGIQVFDRGLLTDSLGDTLDVVGSLEQFGGQLQLNISQDWGSFGVTNVSSGTPPSPVLLTLSQLGEAREGQLVRIDDVEITSGIIWGSGNSTLTIDDGTPFTLRIDGDTDIPGSNTPVSTFDIIGIVTQYDSSFPLTSGYQITPRSKADFISDEINYPDVIISEIHADPDSTNGDANGDGTVSSSHDEFVELWNTTYEDADISDWEIHDNTGLRYTFPSSTVIPPREAVVVFGGGTPTGDFGNADANGLVFTDYLGLNNGGDTITLKDDLGNTIQSVTYGSEGGDNQSLVRSPDFSNAPFIKHSTADTDDGSLYSPGTTIFGYSMTVPSGAVILSEVMYDPTGADGELEWVEICNTSSTAHDLSTMSLGWGGSDYTSGQVTLSGVIPANTVWVIGGPTSSSDNANPTFDDSYEFSPGMQNSGSTADGVALFNLSKSHVDGSTVPIDVVIYGTTNTNNLMDETGSAGSVDVADASAGQTIERTSLAGAWAIQGTPSPNSSLTCNPGSGTPELILTEVFYDRDGTDSGYEWIEIKNIGDGTANLASYSLGWGGSDYTYGTLQLSGTLAAGAVFVVGGATSDSTNHNPTFDQEANFSPDLQNSGSPGDGVALFDVPETSITSSTVPIDAVIYGSNNNSSLLDETGSAGSVDVGDADPGESIERTSEAGAWQIQASPDPGSVSF